MTVQAGAMLNHDATPSYTVNVAVTDPSGGAAATNATVTVMVTDVNEAPTFAAFAAGPPPTNPSVAVIAENATGADALQIGSFSAEDPDDDTASLSLMGPDAGMFEFASDTATEADVVTRILSFKALPDYDMPGDSNGDNLYEVDGTCLGRRESQGHACCRQGDRL